MASVVSVRGARLWSHVARAARLRSQRSNVRPRYPKPKGCLKPYKSRTEQESCVTTSFAWLRKRRGSPDQTWRSVPSPGPPAPAPVFARAGIARTTQCRPRSCCVNRCTCSKTFKSSFIEQNAQYERPKYTLQQIWSSI
eukprot:6186283-Pleurochrysis_carterae.AAC.3